MSREQTLTRFFYGVEERPDAVLCEQLGEASKWVAQHVTVSLLDHQRSALVCLVSDVCAGLAEAPVKKPLEESFLLKVLNRAMFQIAAAEFYEFCYVAGRLNIRAWQKRRAEHRLFSRGTMLF
jgi:GH24 family phage-related lysozyme (muramidase)